MQIVAELNDLHPIIMHLMNVANKEFRSVCTNCQSDQSHHSSQNKIKCRITLLSSCQMLFTPSLWHSTDADQTEQKRYEILFSVPG